LYFLHSSSSVVLRSHGQIYIFITRKSYLASYSGARISYGNSVRLSIRLSWPSTISKPVEIETSGFHFMIAWCL